MLNGRALEAGAAPSAPAATTAASSAASAAPTTAVPFTTASTAAATAAAAPRGKSSLMGASNDLATVTMTGVQNTQNTSYTNSPANSSAPIWMEPRLMCSMPCRLNARPSALLASQCFCRQYQAHSTAAPTPHTSSGTAAVSSTGSDSHAGSFSVPIDSCAGAARRVSARRRRGTADARPSNEGRAAPSCAQAAAACAPPRRAPR
jgi:hypothetical protein